MGRGKGASKAESGAPRTKPDRINGPRFREMHRLQLSELLDGRFRAEIFGLQFELRHQLGILELITCTGGSRGPNVRVILGHASVGCPNALVKEVLSPGVSDQDHGLHP